MCKGILSVNQNIAWITDYKVPPIGDTTYNKHKDIKRKVKPHGTSTKENAANTSVFSTFYITAPLFLVYMTVSIREVIERQYQSRTIPLKT